MTTIITEKEYLKKTTEMVDMSSRGPTIFNVDDYDDIPNEIIKPKFTSYAVTTMDTTPTPTTNTDSKSGSNITTGTYSSILENAYYGQKRVNVPPLTTVDLTKPSPLPIRPTAPLLPSPLKLLPTTTKTPPKISMKKRKVDEIQNDSISSHQFHLSHQNLMTSMNKNVKTIATTSSNRKPTSPTTTNTKVRRKNTKAKTWDEQYQLILKYFNKEQNCILYPEFPTTNSADKNGGTNNTSHQARPQPLQVERDRDREEHNRTISNLRNWLSRQRRNNAYYLNLTDDQKRKLTAINYDTVLFSLTYKGIPKKPITIKKTKNNKSNKKTKTSIIKKKTTTIIQEEKPQATLLSLQYRDYDNNHQGEVCSHPYMSLYVPLQVVKKGEIALSAASLAAKSEEDTRMKNYMNTPQMGLGLGACHEMDDEYEDTTTTAPLSYHISNYPQQQNQILTQPAPILYHIPTNYRQQQNKAKSQSPEELQPKSQETTIVVVETNNANGIITQGGSATNYSDTAFEDDDKDFRSASDMYKQYCLHP